VQHPLAAARAVALVHICRIATGAAVDPVVLAAPERAHDVVAGACYDVIGAGVGAQLIVARSAVDTVGAGPA